MKVKYLSSGARCVCNGKTHEVYRMDGKIITNPCTCPTYWKSRRNKGARCQAMRSEKQCQFPEFHEGDHKF